MRGLIKKILKEEFDNKEVMSKEHNICDVMTVNSWEEIQGLLDNMEYDEKYQREIESIRQQTKKESTYKLTTMRHAPVRIDNNDVLKKIDLVLSQAKSYPNSLDESRTLTRKVWDEISNLLFQYRC